MVYEIKSLPQSNLMFFDGSLLEFSLEGIITIKLSFIT